MVTLACILSFAGSVGWCTERMVRSSRAATILLPVPPLLASWVLLMTMRTPTPGRALLAFTLADLAVLALSVLGVLRLLGGFEVIPDDPCRDDGIDGDDPPTPHRPGPRTPGDVHPARRPGRAPRSNRRRHRVGVRRTASGR